MLGRTWCWKEVLGSLLFLQRREKAQLWGLKVQGCLEVVVKTWRSGCVLGVVVSGVRLVLSVRGAATPSPGRGLTFIEVRGKESLSFFAV